MKTAEIRTKFLEFFRSKDHTIIPSAPVVPEHDPNVLFTTAGMHPLVPYLLGAPHPAGKRLASVQKCVRTTDIEEVGDTTHLTFFEMLGNWSLGDYFKEDSIAWSWEFLTDSRWLGLDPKKLYVSVYQGDAEVPKDEESIKLWQEQYRKRSIEAHVGERILALGRDDNWWEQGGVETSPAGPDTEIFYYLGSDTEPTFDTESTDFVEIWNNVFMAYQRQKNGEYSELSEKNVDTGMGLERIATVMQGVGSVYETDLLLQLAESIERYAFATHHVVFTQTNPESTGRAVRILTDHLRCVSFMAADGVVPSNVERGYVMRRLLRRAIREGLVIGIDHELSANVAPNVIELYRDAYPELENNKEEILKVLDQEEKNFRKTLERGLREFAKMTHQTELDGEMMFRLFDTYGFPKELSLEEAKRSNIAKAEDAEDRFDILMAEQRERSRTATKGQFKGGLADHSEIATQYHTATHLMYRALKNVLGDHVAQRGSNITDERTRFDFTHHEKMTPEQISEVEDIVNDAIARDLPISSEEMPTSKAFESSAIGAFGDKYGDSVSVYTVGDPEGDWYSREICGGPHVGRTGEIGHFKIIKEESSSAGVRRIKAILE